MKGVSRSETRGRLGEIVEVLRRNDIVRGLSPDKLCAILEELGPTFIKLGQIMSMRADFLPKEYCEALTRLRTDVAPMPWEEVSRVLEAAWHRPVEEVLTDFSRETLGSASIAQAHAAVLHTGERVVVKVQREGIHDLMRRDIALMKKGAELLKYTPVGSLVDFNRVLDEMWTVSQQEMDFLAEAQHLEEFQRLNAGLAYVGCPKVFRSYTTATVLVMERIDGLAINDKEALTAAGYDLNEIGAKLADSYVKQITEDGFFHADPHPGNLRVQEGRIIYLDMGMMGRLSERDRKIISRAIEGIARGDAGACSEAIIALGAATGEVDRRKLFRDCESLLDRYAAADLGGMDLSRIMAEVIEIMRANRLKMPESMSMLSRGMATIEGVLADIAPDISIAKVAGARFSGAFLRNVDWQASLQRGGQTIYESAFKAVGLPALLSDALRTVNRGEAGLHVETQPDPGAERFYLRLVRQLGLALICAACILGAALTARGEPVFLGLGWFSIGLLALAGLCAAALFLPGRK
ncbi:MAG: AarF/ABC1/UbiB kinase family protein [Clostridia bacterium]|nr:AarF/ABC1/UbiB kinase family protein [Clostridia bacterium]